MGVEVASDTSFSGSDGTMARPFSEEILTGDGEVIVDEL